MIEKGSYKPCTHHHPLTPSKKGHIHPHPFTPSQKRSHPPTHTWKKEYHVSNTWYIREKYSLFTILAGVFIFEKDWPASLFLLHTFETAFEFVVCLFVCLFVCFQQLANQMSENSKLKVRSVWNIFVFMYYFFCIRSSSILCTVNKVVHVTAKIIQRSKRGRKKTVRC